ncbi:MAG: TonB-dependent receptor [Bacteroidetes bacterium]|nr:TonB-dependent receptor [Bacteroidota bacterium]
MIKGCVTDSETNSPIRGVNVSVLSISCNTTTDSLGGFSLSLNPGKYEICFTHVGYASQSKQITVTPKVSSYSLNISLKPSEYVTNEVIISAERIQGSPSLHVIKENDLKNIPNVYSDIVRSVTILPGVTSDNELTSAYNVRGQNFDANLIYLNGYEIYRPYLVQQGIEENQSAINENMVEDLRFYNGAFPADYGDKMSSVLVVNYKKTQDSILGGEISADLLNLGVTMHDKFGGLKLIAGFRFAYPSSFTSVLQTKGTYIPSYTDFQLLGSYTSPESLEVELLFMTARNTFNLIPQDWTGDFAINQWWLFRRIALKFEGSDNYRYDSNLLGLRFTAPLDLNSNFSASLAYYSDREFYNKNLSHGIYYSPDAYYPQYNVSDLGTGYDFSINSLKMDRLEFKTDFESDYGTHDTRIGIALKTYLMDNSLNESTYYVPAIGAAYFTSQKQQFRFNSISAYVAEDLIPIPEFTFNFGLRTSKYYFNRELLFSPRASVSFELDSVNSLSFGWGYYYQPPCFYETRDKNSSVARSLLSQRVVHYVLKYESRIKSNTDLSAEVYYKSLSRLLPYYYTNQMELTYSDTNNYEGYAYGFDLQYHGELSEGLDTWIGYGYLVARDRKAGSGSPYQRSLLDQTHTIRIFLQDEMPVLRKSEAHVRVLFGTGYLYHPLVNISGTTDSYQIVPDYDNVDQFPFYYRVDMGLTYKFALDRKRNVTLIAEVLNVFNKNNIVSYSWYIIPGFQQPMRVPNLLSARFFNVGTRIEF